MNPRADKWSAPDVVLLFESTAGWNQVGGPELLTTRHHEGKGCNVLFVDYHAEFVKGEEIPRLKWEGTKLEQGGTQDLVPTLMDLRPAEQSDW
jgi:prepilin-type processing-associated H-X9-DG protein